VFVFRNTRSDLRRLRPRPLVYPSGDDDPEGRVGRLDDILDAVDPEADADPQPNLDDATVPLSVWGAWLVRALERRDLAAAAIRAPTRCPTISAHSGLRLVEAAAR
jgi:hypothetical protein